MTKNILKEKYNQEVVFKMKEKFGYKNIMAVPRILKVSLNSGIGKYLKDKEAVDAIVQDFRMISGQKPVLSKAKKSISGFKIRQSQAVGVSVTLRGNRMWDFMQKLISSTLPRFRDFQGIEQKNFDSQGNLNIAVKEHIVFPEIASENVKNIFGVQISITNSARTKKEGMELFRMLGFPIKSD